MCVSLHLRTDRRLGLVPRPADAREMEKQLMEMAPAAWTAQMLDDHHSLVKLHGQQLCPKGVPSCGRCPLVHVCPTGTGLRRG